MKLKMPVRHPRSLASALPAQPSTEAAEALSESLSGGRPPGGGGGSSAASFSVSAGFGSFATSGCLQTGAHAAEAAAARAQHAAAQSVTRALLFPWERRQFDGRGGKLRTWEKMYWGVFVTAVAGLLFSKVLLPSDTKQQEVDEGKEARKKELARLLLAGGLSLTEDDAQVFEGLSPAEIQAYVTESTDGVSSSDPFEGMSPEEINEYLEANVKPR